MSNATRKKNDPVEILIAKYVSHAFRQNVPIAVVGFRGGRYFETTWRLLGEAGYAENGKGVAAFVSESAVETWQDVRESLRSFPELDLKNLASQRGQIIAFNSNGDPVAITEVFKIQESEFPYGIQTIFWAIDGKLVPVGVIPTFWKGNKSIFRIT